MKRDTITREQFLSLGAGDVVLWRDSYLRTIALGPSDYPLEPMNGVLFPIAHRSWTNRVVTCYTWPELRSLIRWTGIKRKSRASVAEIERLKAMHFDPRAEFDREISERLDADKRMNRFSRCRLATL